MIHTAWGRGGRCGGDVSAFTVPMGYDDAGALPDTLVYVCHRCGAEMDTDAEVADDTLDVGYEGEVDDRHGS